MDDLLSLLKAALPGDLASLLSQYLEEPEAPTKTSLTALLPALLGAIFQKGSTPSGADSLLNLLNGPDVDSSIADNIADLFSGSGTGANELLNIGAGLVNQLFGNKEKDFSDALASTGGMKSSSAFKLLALAVPVVLGFLKKYILGKGLDQNSLASLFAGQGKSLEGLLDDGLVKALGFASPAAFLSGLMPPKVEAMAKPAYTPEPEVRKSGSWLPWLLLLLGLVGLLYLWQLFSQSKPVTQAPAPVKVTQVTEVALPAKVYFEVDQAEIGANGRKVIGDVIQIFNKDSGVKIDITGFTDKTGDPEKNLELAKQRALAVRAALIAGGFPDKNITMKPPFFVTGSGSDAEARRVDISKSP
jgi:flagellar motor protein MotB